MCVMRKDAKNHNTFARITYVHIIKNPQLLKMAMSVEFYLRKDNWDVDIWAPMP